MAIRSSTGWPISAPNLTGDNTFTGNNVFTESILLGSAVTESLYTIPNITNFVIDPNNGPVQVITLGASSTPIAQNWSSGQKVLLRIADGTSYTINWGTVGVVWFGGSSPTLSLLGYTIVYLFKLDTTIYGYILGNV